MAAPAVWAVVAAAAVAAAAAACALERSVRAQPAGEVSAPGDRDGPLAPAAAEDLTGPGR